MGEESEKFSAPRKLIWNLTDPPALNAGARCHGWSILIILGTEKKRVEKMKGVQWGERGRERKRG